MNTFHQTDDQKFIHFLKVNLFLELWKFKFYAISLIILGLSVGALLSFLVPPIFETIAVIRPPFVLGKPLMSSEIIIEQFKYSSYQSELMDAINPTPTSIDRERFIDILDNVQVSKISGNLIMKYQGKKSELDDSQIDKIAQSVVKSLNKRYETRVSILKFKLMNIESRIKIASGDKDYLLSLVKKNFSGATRPEGSDSLFLSSLISSKNFEIDNLFLQKFELDDQLSSDKTYPGAIVNSPTDSYQYKFPNKKVFIIAGAASGLILAMLIIFFRKIFLGSK